MLPSTPQNPTGQRGWEVPNSIRPPTFTLTMSADQQTLYATFTYGPSVNFLDFVPTIRIWYIDGTLVSQQQVSTPAGIAMAGSSLLTSFPVSRGKLTFQIPFTIAAYPLLFSHGGWLWVDSIGTSETDFFPSTGLVPIPSRSETAVPVASVDIAAVAISTVTIFGASYKKLLFSWMNPNPIDKLYYVLVIMYNYRNAGLYEELGFFPTVQANGSQTTPSNVQRGASASVGPFYLVSDFDGAHNVIFYFVAENRSHMHASTWVGSAFPYTAVGGV